MTEVGEALVRDAAADAEELKLYRALAPTAVLRLPLPARRPDVGLVTLGMAERHSAPLLGRRCRAWPRSSVGDVGLAVENVRRREDAQATARRARLVFEAHPQPMWIFDVDTLAFLAVNEAAVHHYGWSREEFLAMTIMDLLAPEDLAPSAAGPDDRVAQRGEVALAHHRRRDGTVVDMEIACHELELDGRRARLVLAGESAADKKVEALGIEKRFEASAGDGRANAGVEDFYLSMARRRAASGSRSFRSGAQT